MAEFSTEGIMQSFCFQWHWCNFPEERRMLHMNDNNSYNRIEGNRKKAMGVVKGVSDFELTGHNGITWYIELKMPGETQSDEQKDFQAKVVSRGHPYIIVYSGTEFKRLINSIYGTQVE